MATHIQQNSQAELKAYLEERLRAQFPSASSQDIVNAAEVALGHKGYVLHTDQRDQQRNSQQQDQQRNSQQQDQQRNSQQSNQQQALASVVSVREAAISAAQAISEPTIKMAAIASAWVAFVSTNAAHESSQQKIGRN